MTYVTAALSCRGRFERQEAQVKRYFFLRLTVFLVVFFATFFLATFFLATFFFVAAFFLATFFFGAAFFLATFFLATFFFVAAFFFATFFFGAAFFLATRFFVATVRPPLNKVHGELRPAGFQLPKANESGSTYNSKTTRLVSQHRSRPKMCFNDNNAK